MGRVDRSEYIEKLKYIKKEIEFHSHQLYILHMVESILNDLTTEVQNGEEV